jgi:hypothetical protein
MDKIELTILVNKVNSAKVKEVGTATAAPLRPHDRARSRRDEGTCCAARREGHRPRHTLLHV